MGRPRARRGSVPPESGASCRGNNDAPIADAPANRTDGFDGADSARHHACVRTPDPYRVLFPLGLLFGLIGAGSWPVHLLGIGPYPAALHRALMVQGFEHGFVLGFLLTAMP